MTATTTVRPTRLLDLPTWIAKHKALVAFCALVGAYYLWTAWSSGSPVAFGQDRTDYFNLLADGFLSGHLHLNVAPDPSLLALPNPYDPTANQGFRVQDQIQDLSLYHGKYYLYWGPTPALLLYIPFRLLGLGDLPETLAVFVFAFVGFCFSIACLRALAQRFVPDAPRWMLGAAAVALAFGNALPFTLRRIAIYEVAITAGFCLSFIALYLVITGLRDGVRLGRLGAASLLVGLAVGARPTMIVWALGLAVVATLLYRRAPDWETGERMVAVLLGPVLLVGSLLMLYNVARFGSPVDFGQKYQLASYDPTTRAGNKLAFVPPGMWYYLLAAPRLTLAFPFIHLPPQPESYPFTAPAEYTGVEMVGGLLLTMPFVVFAAVAPAVLRGTARRAALGLVAIGLLIIVMVSFALWGATMRYEVDFASVLLIAAALGWFASAARLSGLRRRVLAGGGVLLIAWGVVCGAAFGISGYFQGLRTFSPKTFTRLQNFTSLLPTAISYLDGEPKTVETYAPDGVERKTNRQVAHSVTFNLSNKPAVLTVVSGSARRYGLKLSAAPAKPPPRGAVVTVRMRDTGKALRIPATLGPTVLPISLRRGLNRIEFRVTRPAGATTRLADVHIVPLHAAAP
jgi:glycopeptide antibiotics resistance protein